MLISLFLNTPKIEEKEELSELECPSHKEIKYSWLMLMEPPLSQDFKMYGKNFKILSKKKVIPWLWSSVPEDTWKNKAKCKENSTEDLLAQFSSS